MSILVYRGKDVIGKPYYVAVDTTISGKTQCMARAKDAMNRIGVVQYDMKEFTQRDDTAIREWTEYKK